MLRERGVGCENQEKAESCEWENLANQLEWVFKKGFNHSVEGNPAPPAMYKTS